MELYKLRLDPACEWDQEDAKVLCFCSRGSVKSPDLVLDVIGRNRGTIGRALTGIEAEVFDRRLKIYGLPGDGLLFPQITYTVSIQGGKSGVHFGQCDPHYA